MKPLFKILLSICLALAVVNAMGLPTITTQPTGKSVSLGATVTFQVRATGVPPLSYQWRRTSIDIAGAITNSLSLTNTQSLNSGDYVLVVTDASGSVTSRVATLQVDTAFTKITTGPIATEGGESTPCGWGDNNYDGWLDMLIGSWSANAGDQTNNLYYNNSDGVFIQPAATAIESIVTDAGGFHGATWVDGCDGFLDIFVAHPKHGVFTIL